jgi:hypothetical protein
MRPSYAIWAVAAIIAPLRASGADTVAFPDRVALAKRVETQPEAAQYLKSQMYPAIGPALASAMRACLPPGKPSPGKFAVVADLSQEGKFVKIDYEPKVEAAACLANAMATFHAPRPVTCGCELLPIVIEMSVVP